MTFILTDQCISGIMVVTINEVINMDVRVTNKFPFTSLKPETFYLAKDNSVWFYDGDYSGCHRFAIFSDGKFCFVVKSSEKYSELDIIEKAELVKEINPKITITY